MTTCTGIAGGHLTNTSDPGWCVYCGLEIQPPPWGWVTARQAVIVRAAETARRQHQDRRRREERLDEAARRVDALAAWGRIDATITLGTSAATWSNIIRRITAA